MTTPQPAALPELPDVPPIRFSTGLSVEWAKMYTAEQMRAYALAALQSQPAAFAPTVHIKEPYTLAELNARIASNDYNAELLLQHAMLLLNAQPAAAGVSDDDLRAMWRQHGGMFHGPLIETGTMPEAKLLAFLRAILRPQAVPMTDDAQRQWRFIRDRLNTTSMYQDSVGKFVEWFEAHHGITAQGAQGGEG